MAAFRSAKMRTSLTEKNNKCRNDNCILSIIPYLGITKKMFKSVKVKQDSLEILLFQDISVTEEQESNVKQDLISNEIIQHCL